MDRCQCENCSRLLKNVSINIPSFPTRSWSVSSKPSLPIKSSSWSESTRRHLSMLLAKNNPRWFTDLPCQWPREQWIQLCSSQPRRMMVMLWQHCMRGVWGSLRPLCTQKKLQRHKPSIESLGLEKKCHFHPFCASFVMLVHCSFLIRGNMSFCYCCRSLSNYTPSISSPHFL